MAGEPSVEPRKKVYIETVGCQMNVLDSELVIARLRQDGYELSDGKQSIGTVPKAGGAYDLKALTETVLAVKREHPTSEDASVLSEPKVPYDELIQAMDAIRSAELPAADPLVAGAAVPPTRTGAGGAAPQTVKVALFTNIALGDAP